LLACRPALGSTPTSSTAPRSVSGWKATRDDGAEVGAVWPTRSARPDFASGR
jgi:hypothetical protein